ncbi:urease accessory protein UreF [Paracoccus sp. (in: a-proteobacteria)]|uniref:urease accessory protein UreF n=1 Tax=Paracoccus sp. TaxID=267 RepID=UPI0034CEC3B7
MTELAGLQKLALWLSPGFPISAYAYSHGVEQAIADGAIHDAATAQGWIADLLAHGAGRNDAILLVHAWRGADVADLALALTGAASRRREAVEQGAAFARIISATEAPLPAAPYPVVVGQAAARAGAALPETLVLFLQAFASTLTTVCVKSVPLGQTQGQSVLTALLPLIRSLAGQAASASLDDLGGACLWGDLAAIRHETLEPRIYRT